MDINLVNFVGYFILYLFIGFTFFYFTLLKKAGSNIVGTICIILVIVSLGIGFMSELHLAILNIFMLVLGFYFAYTLMKMHRDDKIAEEKRKSAQERAYHERLKKHKIEENTE